MNEQHRIQQAYDKRNRAVDSARYSYFYDGNMAMYQQRERVLLRMLRYVFGGVVSDKKVLDIGCGG